MIRECLTTVGLGYNADRRSTKILRCGPFFIKSDRAELLKGDQNVFISNESFDDKAATLRARGMEGLGPPRWSNYLKSLVLALLCLQAQTQLPIPCTDLKPIYLLNIIAPDRHRLPPGVEISYDEKVNLHAYRFSHHASNLNFPSSLVFRYCEYFPEEFSILVTLKPGSQDFTEEQALFSIIPFNDLRPKLGLELSKGKLRYFHMDRVTKKLHSVEYKMAKLFDGDWHTIIVSITGTTINLKLDCGKNRMRKIRRAFPSFLGVRDTNIHVGNAKKRKTYFKGLLKQMLILPGSDATYIACPSTSPNIPHISRVPPVIDNPPGLPPMYELQARCSWRETGKMWFDVIHKTLNVCYSGIWQTVLLPPDKRVPKRLDYIEWYQDIVTAAPTIDIEIFRIPDVGLFMAAASYSDNREPKKQQSGIFIWKMNRFTFYQSLYTLGAQAWEHFTIGKHFFLAVANHGQRSDRPSKSVLYRWSWKQRRFKVHQELVTWTARDLEYFEIGGEHYLAVANHVKGENHTIGSDVYQWDKRTRKFEVKQTIGTVGAYDWTHFHVGRFHFLAVANSFSGPPLATTRIDSVIYFWENGHFIKFQTFETTGATDWEFFTIKGTQFLVVSNAFNYGPHTTKETERYQTSSTIYRLNKEAKRFEPYQHILTYSAVDWEAFQIGDDTFLIVSNSQQYGSSINLKREPLERYTSVLYRWQGVEKFVPIHYLDTHASADWEFFTANGEYFLIYANAKDNISQVYRIKLT